MYGLNPKETRVFVYDYAKANMKKYPGQWETNGMAGVDWFTDFMKRNSKYLPTYATSCDLRISTKIFIYFCFTVCQYGKEKTAVWAE